MSVNRKIVSVSIDTSDTSNYEDDLRDAINAAVNSSDNFRTVYVEKKAAASNKEAYVIWLEEVV